MKMELKANLGAMETMMCCLRLLNVLMNNEPVVDFKVFWKFVEGIMFDNSKPERSIFGYRIVQVKNVKILPY